MKSVFLILALLALPLQRANAHGELHEQIVAAAAAIAKEPARADLYLKRSELHRYHRAWDAALADLERAEALSNRWHTLHFARAGVYLDAEWFESAKAAADRFLAVEPRHAAALVVRARARERLGEHLGAADDFTRAIAASAEPAPELYIERAQAEAAEGGPHVDAALRGLDQGMAKLGNLVTLQMAAIELEAMQHRVDAALARVDSILANAPRKETWLTRRGEILQQTGRTAEAAQSFQAALAALESLPPNRRSVSSMRDLEARIRAGLAAAAIP
jgi:predicted negative regulator of RcsB-dependent stress response